MMYLWRWRFDLLLRRLRLLSRWLGRSGMYNPGLRSRSMMDLWRRRFDFLLRRRHIHFGSRFWGGRRLWSGLWRGDFSRGCFYLRGRFRCCHIRRLMRRRRGRF